MTTDFRLSGLQHQILYNHLYPGDNKESVAIILCGRYTSSERNILLAQKIVIVPYDKCSIRTHNRLTWSTEILLPVLEEAIKHNLSIIKIHSHPGGYEQFSMCDDESDKDLFSSIVGWVEGPGPHASTIMLPNGSIFGRVFWSSGDISPLDSILVVGDNISIWTKKTATTPPAFTQRHNQLFGSGTLNILRQLAVAVVGCSGTGGPVIEQLARLGIGKLVLVDPDRVEVKNLNRIPNTTMADALSARFKVEVFAQTIVAMGLGTNIVTFNRSLFDPEVVRSIAGCDIIFGCVDSLDGRHTLNRLSVFYNLPYFDLGIKLEADGLGGISQICGTVHYLQPGRSSLLSRGVYTLEQVRSAGLKRASPEEYNQQVKEKYIIGVQEERPAVISVNTLISSLAVNEFLARLHPYRDDDNAQFATYRISLTQSQLYTEPDSEPCPVLSRHIGRGDVKPTLDMPELDGIEGAA